MHFFKKITTKKESICKKSENFFKKKFMSFEAWPQTDRQIYEYFKIISAVFNIATDKSHFPHSVTYWRTDWQTDTVNYRVASLTKKNIHNTYFPCKGNQLVYKVN